MYSIQLCGLVLWLSSVFFLSIAEIFLEEPAFVTNPILIQPPYALIVKEHHKDMEQELQIGDIYFNNRRNGLTIRN